MTWLHAVPELQALETRSDLIRIPPEVDVPITPRVRALVDTPQFRRLAQVSQLGLVSLAYPAAIHTRFEHSLGVYRLALLFLRQLHSDERFRTTITADHASLLIAAALLHDIAHWPFCHPIEDLSLPSVPIHEELSASLLTTGELAEILKSKWNVDPGAIVRLLNNRPKDKAEKILATLLSGPIDMDKMDYLARDSLHAGVPYGRNFDQLRLIASLCLNSSGDGLAITDKGRTAAEMLVFARYVMFSEVYWHHTIRAATAMIQRAYVLLEDKLSITELSRATDHEWISAMRNIGKATPASELLEGLFGPTRRIYKRLAQFNYLEERELYEKMTRRPYSWLQQVSANFARLASEKLGKNVAPDEILFDAPPMEREIQFDLDVYHTKESRYRRLGDVSPVVRTLAREQFDDYVKRVRIYVHPRWRDELRALSDLSELVKRAIGE